MLFDTETEKEVKTLKTIKKLMRNKHIKKPREVFHEAVIIPKNECYLILGQ